MKKNSKPGPRPFLLKLLDYGNTYYIDRIAELEAALAKNPRELQIDLVGSGEIPADMALLIRSILNQRSPKTRVITNARSSLQSGSVLVWLVGDHRLIRENARIFFRRAEETDTDDAEADNWESEADNYSDSFSQTDPDEADYARMLQVINEFLPVKELAGRLVEVPVLRQFGLVDNERLNRYLNTAFDQPLSAASHAASERKDKRNHSKSKAASSGSIKK